MSDLEKKWPGFVRQADRTLVLDRNLDAIHIKTPLGMVHIEYFMGVNENINVKVINEENTALKRYGNGLYVVRTESP